jgi:hypothetical protein
MKLKYKIENKLRNITGMNEMLSKLETFNNVFKELNDESNHINTRFDIIENRINEVESSFGNILEKGEGKINDFEYFIKNLRRIQIESTNNCIYHCTMCPHDEMKRQKGYMSIDGLNWILENIIAYNPEFSGRFHLHGTGECLLDKHLAEKINIIQNKLPGAYIELFSTLGYELPESEFEALINNGLKAIWVSCYGTDSRSYQAIHGVDKFDLVMHNLNEMEGLKKKYSERFSVNIQGPFKITDKPSHDIFKQSMLDRGFNY